MKAALGIFFGAFAAIFQGISSQSSEIVIEPIKQSQNEVVEIIDVFHNECQFEEEDRQECGKRTYDERECRSRGCCWEPCEGCAKEVPWCFLAKRMLQPQCLVPYEEKDDCGYYGITEGECYMRGCCWAPSPLVNSPPCFKESDRNEIRLVDGSSESSGRVEILHEGEWGTVCDDNFYDEEAGVVCRSLGFETGVARRDGYFGEGRGRIWLDGFDCEGHEERLEDCHIPEWGVNDCSHSEDAEVTCYNGEEESPTEIRLVNGETPASGRVEIYYQGEWGTICDDDFFEDEANVVCRSLGYQGGEARREGYYGEGSGRIWLDGFDCRGDEEHLEDCQISEWGVNDCSHYEDAGVTCYNGEEEVSIEIRLVNGETPASGRVEIYYQEEWGTICDDNFYEAEANVVCHSLGYQSGEARREGYYGEGSGRIWLDSFDCGGHEERLEDCQISEWGVNDCSHSEDAGVICYDGSLPASEVRLVNGNSMSSGRVEIYHSGEWGTVCDDNFFDDEADVVCRYLGYERGEAKREAYYGAGSGRIWLDGFDCDGSEASLDQCGIYVWGANDCSHAEDAGVSCYGDDTESEESGMSGSGW